jgi:hypothetical protein
MSARQLRKMKKGKQNIREGLEANAPYIIRKGRR